MLIETILVRVPCAVDGKRLSAGFGHAVFRIALTVTLLPEPRDNHDGVTRIGDTQNRLRAWFAQHNAALVVMRPDRFVAAIAIPQTLGSTLNKLASVMTLTRATADIPVEKVA